MCSIQVVVCSLPLERAFRSLGLVPRSRLLSKEAYFQVDSVFSFYKDLKGFLYVYVLISVQCSLVRTILYQQCTQESSQPLLSTIQGLKRRVLFNYLTAQLTKLFLGPLYYYRGIYLIVNVLSKIMPSSAQQLCFILLLEYYLDLSCYFSFLYALKVKLFQ